jgi:hypothetical protein
MKPGKSYGLVVIFAAAAAIPWGCGRPTGADATSQDVNGPVWFQDITEESGLNFVHDAGPVDGKFFLPQIIGSGAALFDFDNDGRLDILLLQNGGPRSASTNRLFRQVDGGRFVDVSAGSGLDFAGYNMGVAIGDVNNDGWPDVLITQFGGIKLFLNNGDGRSFTDATHEAGLDSLLWGTSAAFFDYDRDGWLDLVVVNYVDYDPSVGCAVGGRAAYCHPSTFRGTVAKLYHNLGRVGNEKRVRFEDVTLKSGLGLKPGPGLGVACADFNGDGWPDIFVANDDKANHLWINQHDGTFKEEALTRGLAYNLLSNNQGNMGVALGDVDGNGEFDVLVTHLTEETHALWLQGPRGLFRDRTAAAGLTRPRWRGTGFGTILADFDHDGALDLAIVNGRVAAGPVQDGGALGPHWSQYAERNQLFANDGSGKFHDASLENAPFCRQPRVSRGLVCGDIDNNGAMDLMITTVAGPARLYRNVAPKKGHWLLVRALDPRLHRDAYGARILLQSGERRWTGWINPGQSYLCSNDARAHFGLGPVEKLDSLRILWPDGLEEDFGSQLADRMLTLRRGEGRKIFDPQG